MLSSDKPAALRGETERDVDVERQKAQALTPEQSAALLQQVKLAAQAISAEGRFYENPLDAVQSQTGFSAADSPR